MADVIRFGDLPVDIGDTTTARARALVAARDRLLADERVGTEVPTAATQAVLLARVGGTLLAVPLDVVAGILATPRTYRVPGAPPEHLGLFSHAGATVNLLAVDAAIGTGPASGGTALLLSGGGARMALAVDEAVGLGQASDPIADNGASPAPLAAVVGHGDLPLVNVQRVLVALGCDSSGEREFDA